MFIMFRKIKHLVSQTSGSVPLPMVLVVPFVVQIFATVGLIGYLSFRTGQKAVNELAIQLSTRVTERINQHLKNYLETPHFMQAITVSSIRNGNLDINNFTSLQQQFWSDIQLSDAVDYIFLGDQDGNFIGVQEYRDGGKVVKFRDRATAPKRLIYALDEDGERTELLKSQDYDPRTRPWYQATLKAQTQTWSSIYISADLGILQITPATPIYDQQGTLQGVLGTNLILSQISGFLRNLEISKSGQAFIIERSANIVASSTDELPYISTNSVPIRLNALNSQKPSIKLTTQELFQQVDNLNQINQPLQFAFELNNKTQLVQVSPLTDVQGLDWLIVVRVPEADFMAQITANTRTTILLCLAALGVATILGILTARWVTQPILSLNTAAKEIAKGKWEKIVEINRSDEVGELAKSFNSMAKQLHESFETLEEKVEERTAQLAQANGEIRALNQRLKAENLRMSAQLDVAKQLQQMVLPKPAELEAIEGLDIAGFMEPVDEVGGDYYDILHHDDVVTIGIGDVAGHGLESGVVMLMAQTAIRTLQEMQETDLVKFLDVINRTIYHNVERMNSDRNMTLAILNYCGGRISISGQHEEIIVVRASGKIERVDTIDLGFPIGLDEEITQFISHVSVQLEFGDGIVLYTDGITEAENMEGKQYGLEQLCQIVSQNWQGAAEAIQQIVIDDVRRHIGSQKVYDDITLLVLKQK